MHIWKWTCSKHHMFVPLLEVEMSKKCTLLKVSKVWGFCSSFKNVGRRGTFEENLQTCISRDRRNTRNMFSRDVWRSGRRFPEKGCILEHEIFRFAKVILRDGCSTSYDLAPLLRARRNSLEAWTGKIAKKNHWYEAVSSTFNFPLLKEVSQNCFVFDVVNLKNWGILAE